MKNKNRNDFVEEIRRAKKAHLKWVSYAYGLIEGLPLEREQVPVFETDCAFGHWYYGPGQVLNQLQAFRDLEEPHRELHQVYMRIFKILFQDEDRGLWSRLFGRSAKQDSEKKELALSHFYELRSYSTQLINGLDALEEQLRNMSDEEFSRTFGASGGDRKQA